MEHIRAEYGVVMTSFGLVPFEQLVDSLEEEDRGDLVRWTFPRAVEELDSALVVRVQNQMGEDRYQRAGSGARHQQWTAWKHLCAHKTYFIPTPPAIKTTLWTWFVWIPGGGQTKLPPTLICNSVPSILFALCHCQTQVSNSHFRVQY